MGYLSCRTAVERWSLNFGNFVLLVLVILAPLPSRAENPPPLIPEPQEVMEGSGQFFLDSTTTVVLGTDVRDRAGIIPEEVNALLESFGVKHLRVVDEGRDLPARDYLYFGLLGSSKAARNYLADHGIAFTEAMHDEGYVLASDENRVFVAAETPEGLFYGCITLLQLLQHTEGREVPSVRIVDWPLLKLRGISDDMSRGQVSTLSDLKRIVRNLAFLKLNLYSPYIEDIFEFKKHPDIGVGRGRISRQEASELVAYAKRYFVDVVPTFETLGHQENLLLRPEYLKYAEFPGAHAFNVSSEDTYSLLRDMIDDLASVFPSKYFNMAADESWDVGRGASRDRVTELGIATVHARHYRRVYDMLKKHGKTVMMYGDILLSHPDILSQIPKDIVIVDWQYHADVEYPSARTIADSGFQFIVSPASWNFVNPFPQYATAVPNIKNFIRDGYRAGAMGALNSTWGDYGGETFRELNWYGYAWGAECSWSPERADFLDFNRRFFSYFFGRQGEEVELIYTLLFAPANMVYWHEVWRHPFLPVREEFVSGPRIAIDIRLQSLNSTMPEVLRLIDRARSVVSRNSDHLDYLEFIARLKLWFAGKVDTALKIDRLLADSSRIAAEGIDAAGAVEQMVEPVVSTLSDLKSRFRSLWLLTNRPDNLDLLLKRYDRQAAYWEEKLVQVKGGRWNVDPTIPSEWIFHPDGRPGARDSLQVQHAYFRKEFGLESRPRNALLQVIGDSYAAVYVNGAAVGTVYATRSLSLTVEEERVKLLDITPLLHEGKNVIAAEVRNFFEGFSAGVNIEAEVTGEGATDTVFSDTTWVVSDSVLGDWTSVDYNADSWRRVQVRPWRWTVVRPNFATRRSSWIER